MTFATGRTSSRKVARDDVLYLIRKKKRVDSSDIREAVDYSNPFGQVQYLSVIYPHWDGSSLTSLIPEKYLIYSWS